MSDASQDASTRAAAADPESAAQAAAAAAAKAAAEEAAARHEARIGVLAEAHAAVEMKLAALREHLDASLAKARTEPDHANYTADFLRDVDLKADEIIAWIKRHV